MDQIARSQRSGRANPTCNQHAWHELSIQLTAFSVKPSPLELDFGDVLAALWSELIAVRRLAQDFRGAPLIRTCIALPSGISVPSRVSIADVAAVSSKKLTNPKPLHCPLKSF